MKKFRDYLRELRIDILDEHNVFVEVLLAQIVLIGWFFVFMFLLSQCS